MKKVLQQGAKWIFGLFALAVFGLMISLTYQALQRIFPTRFDNQIWGLVLFDIAAVVWAVAYIFHSKSTAQYAASGIGFLTGLLGTLGMIAAEVTLGSNLVTADPQQIGQWLLWGFIGTTALHLILIYMHHFTAPELAEQINVGIARGEITTEAIRQATQGLEQEKAQLAESIARGIKEQVMRDLNLPIPANNTVFDPKTYEQAVPHPIQQSQTEFAKYTELLNDKAEPGTPDNYGPLWKSSTDITPTLDQHNWVCLCSTRNMAGTRDCWKCGQPRTNASPVTAFFDNKDGTSGFKPQLKDEAQQPKPPFRGSPSE